MRKEELIKKLQSMKMWDEEKNKFVLTDYSINYISGKIQDSFKLSKINKILLETIEIKDVKYYQDGIHSVIIELKLLMNDYAFFDVNIKICALIVEDNLFAL